MNTYKTVTLFQNLIPLENYSYFIESIDGNWPVTASPVSGSFIPISGSYEIDTSIKFCVSSGICTGPNLLSYQTETCALDTTPFVEFRVGLDLPYSDQKIYGATQRLECEDCLKQHKISTFSSNFVNNELVNISGFVSGLIPDRIYLYNLSSLGGSYPLATQNTSGSFIAQSDKENIVIDAAFCCPSGSCFGNIFPKTYNSFRAANTLEHTVILDITDMCSNLSQSKHLKISQDKQDPNFIKPNDFTLTKNSKGCSRLNFSLTNLLKDHSYSYVYKSKDGNWPVYIENISGVVSNTSDSADIGTNIAFCPSSGLCSGLTTLGQQLPISNNKINNYCANNENNKYISLYVEVTPNCYPESVVFSSESVTVYCNDCISSAVVSFSE